MITQRMIENMLNDLGDKYSFEEILEMFDVDKTDVFLMLFNSGHIDEGILENLCNV